MSIFHFSIHLIHPYHPALFLFYVLCMISSISVCVSEIKDTYIIDDSRPMILFEQFGFAHGGHVSVLINGVSWKSSHQDVELDRSSMGFFLVRESSYSLILNESEYIDNFCVVSSRYVNLIFKFDKVSIDSAYNDSIIIEDPGEYSLVFGNCQSEFEVSMHVHTEMYNVEGIYGTKNFLPAGQTQLPKVYFLFFIIYSTFFATWLYVCIKQRLIVDKIHIIMAALLLFKGIKMICAAEDKQYVKRTGSPHGWDIAFYIFGFFKGITLFIVIVLIGTGWSFLKPYLQDREKKVLMTVVPLQVLENLASAVIGETGPSTKDWLTWNQIFLLIDIICCCAVFFPIIWSIRSLREASKTDGKAARNLEKLQLFKQFYVVVVGYLYFTRVVAFLLDAIILYRFEWVITVAVEGASLGFYLFVFYNFQPVEKNPYLVIDDEEEAAAAHMLDEDDSFEL